MTTPARTPLAALGCALVITACGSASHRTTTTTSPELAVSECMRSHGVRNFPDPHMGSGGNEGMTVLFSSNGSLTVQGIAFGGPAFNAAEKTCGFLSGGGSGPPQLSESYRLAALHFAQCMRAHGVPNFADPTLPADGGIQNGPGAGIDRNAPAVLRAAKTCNRP